MPASRHERIIRWSGAASARRGSRESAGGRSGRRSTLLSQLAGEHRRRDQLLEGGPAVPALFHVGADEVLPEVVVDDVAAIALGEFELLLGALGRGQSVLLQPGFGLVASHLAVEIAARDFARRVADRGGEAADAMKAVGLLWIESRQREEH